MQNRHQKLFLYQLLLIFHVDPPPHGMQLNPVLVILLNNTLPVLLPVVQNPYILLHLQVWVCLFHHLFIYHIHQYLIKNANN